MGECLKMQAGSWFAYIVYPALRIEKCCGMALRDCSESFLNIKKSIESGSDSEDGSVIFLTRYKQGEPQ